MKRSTQSVDATVTFLYAPSFMPTFETLRLRRPRPGAPMVPLTNAPLAPVVTFLLGTDGDRPPRDVDLTLLLPPLFNGKPTRNSATVLF